MKVSLNLLSEFVEIYETPEQIIEVLTNLGLEIENVFYSGQKYKNFIIAKVIDLLTIPNSKNLLCRLSDGKLNYEVVCGAKNVAFGQNVVLALPGAILPKNELKIEPIEIDGVWSQGMICSEDELDIGNDSNGILVIEDEANIGKSFADYFGLNDVVFDVSITPNRADCLSHLGIARELSAFFNRKLAIPKIEYPSDTTRNVEDFIEVEICDEEKCPRYTAKVLIDVNVIQSPKWLKSRLIVLGLRPINVIVDVTNYVMMELGQPLHAFDLDKLAGNKIVIRTAKSGEKFVTLDGKERELDSTILMICDEEKPVAIGGVMGGENSQITDSTRNVLIESAYFLPSSIRRTSKKLALSSESSYRFERGVDIENIVRANERATQLISYFSGGKVLKGIVDKYPTKFQQKFVKFRYYRAKKIIGQALPNEKILSILESLGFQPEAKTEKDVLFSVPSFRVDIQYEIDLIEEVARFYGYDNIPEDTNYIVTKSFDNTPQSLTLPQLRKLIRDYFIANGFSEFLTPNLYDPKRGKIFDEESNFIRLANPLGEELSIMRSSIIPSTLEAIKYNFRVGRKDLRIFEIGKEFSCGNSNSSFIKGILEREILIFAICGLSAPLQWGFVSREVDFYDLKGIVEHFLANLGIKNYKMSDYQDLVFSSESQEVVLEGRRFGIFGSISEGILKTFDIEKPVYLGKFFIENLRSYQTSFPKYSKISPFPTVRRDLAFVVDEDVKTNEIETVIKEGAGKYLKEVIIFDVFKGRNIGEKRKSIAFALFFSSMEKTLTDEEVDESVRSIIENVRIRFSAELRTF